MQRQIIVVFLSLVFLVLPSAWGAERGALFKVTAKGHTMYLFGTMHVGRKEFYPLEPKIMAAVATASTIALEIDPYVDKTAQSAMFMAQGLVTSPNSLNNLPPAVKSRLTRVLTKSNINPALMAEFKPWFIATLLAVGEYVAQGYGPEFGVDEHVAKLAKSAKIRILALETAQYQLSLFNAMSHAEQVGLLDESLKQIEAGKQAEEIRQIVTAWSGADKKALDLVAERIASDNTAPGKFLKRVLLDERNVGMAEKLFALLGRESNTVAAVGTLHLIGSNSIPALLSARGVTVEQIY